MIKQEILELLRLTGGNELVTQLLEKYRTTYKSRTKMIEALKDL